MDFSKYDNREEIEALEAEIQAISADLHICGIISYGTRATRARTMVREKGNARIIEELTRLGFIKVSREKVVTPKWLHCNESGYYIVRMEKSM